MTLKSIITDELRGKADELRGKADELYHGDAMCQEKSKFLLTEMDLPNGLLPMKDMEECGYIKETGFIWLKQKKSTTHKFEKVGRPASYATEITAYVEKGRIKKLTGVKSKEMMVWLTIGDIYLEDPPTKITFKSPTGLSRTFPTAAFVIDGPEAGKVVEEFVDVPEAETVEV